MTGPQHFRRIGQPASRRRGVRSEHNSPRRSAQYILEQSFIQCRYVRGASKDSNQDAGPATSRMGHAGKQHCSCLPRENEPTP